MSVGGSKQIATVECLKVVGRAEVGAQEAGRQADVCQGRPSRIFRFVACQFFGRSRADLPRSWQSAALLPSCACASLFCEGKSETKLPSGSQFDLKLLVRNI